MVSVGSSLQAKRKAGAGSILWPISVIVAFLGGLQMGLLSPKDNSPYSTTTAIVAPRSNTDSFKLAYNQSYGFFDDISDSNWKLMQQRASQRINHKFIQWSKWYHAPAQWYMNNFEPDFTCGQERRIGGPGDGPKWVCDPHRLPKIVERRTALVGAEKARCLIYSVGSGGKWQFEDGMYELLDGLCEIHVFDPGNFAKDRDDLEGRNVHFHKWGFKSSYDEDYKPVVNYGEFISVQETVKKLGHEGRTIDIFKIDCEYCEWYCFEDWFKIDIRILLVETHGLPENTDKAYNFFYGFQKANFLLYHKEPNIHPKAKGEGVEWAYIRLHPDFMKNETVPSIR